MQINTRFNPTINGALHVGHLYIALVNEVEAHCTGGKFYVRVDDTQSLWSAKLGKERVDQYYYEYQEQLSQFMKIDLWDRQSYMPTPEEIIGAHALLSAHSEVFDTNNYDVEYQKRLGRGWQAYSPGYLVEKVIWDYYENINLLIRGEDLITEANLYTHFIEEIGLPRVRQVYLPYLERKESGERVSKTAGTYVLAKQIDAFGVEGTLSRLRESCLVDVEGEFVVDNIQVRPIVRGFIE